MSFNINFVGHIPFNPDNLLDKRRSSNRPAGFNYLDIIKMYWTVRSFKVNINILNTNIDDPLFTFMLAGGTSGGIIGAQAGLAAVNQSLGKNPGSIGLNGYTKITKKYDLTVRKKRSSSVPFDGYKGDVIKKEIDSAGNIIIKDFDIDESLENPYLFTEDLKPNEGTLCSAGPVHSIVKPGAYLQIDLSDIIYYKKKYWPIIIFTAFAGETTYSSSPFGFGGANTDVQGGFTIMDVPIPVYANMTFSIARRPGGLIVADGKVVPGDRCCDRFFWDDKDKEREKDSKCSKNCSDDISEGVYKKSKDKK